MAEEVLLTPPSGSREVRFLVNSPNPVVYFIAIVRVVPQTRPHLFRCKVGQLSDPLQVAFLFGIYSMENTGDFPDVGTTDQSQATARGSRTEDDPWVCRHAEPLVEQALRNLRQRLTRTRLLCASSG